MKVSVKIKVFILLVCIFLSSCSYVFAKNDRPNVLMIICDDLNHWVGHLGRNKQVITPNIDRLAARGVSFEHAYCATPQCNPSRTSFFTGRRPHTTGVYANATGWKGRINEADTLNVHFYNNGYHIAAAGKVYAAISKMETGINEYGQAGEVVKARVLDSGVAASQTWKILDGDDDCAKDEKTVRWVVERLGKKYDKPLFMIAGLHKPHLKFEIPKKYYDMYPLDKVKLPPIKEDDLEDLDMNAAFAISGKHVFAKDEPQENMRKMIRGYLAAVSYCDAQVGRIIKALDEGPNKDNTIIMLWGDHGYHLGEKHMAAKRLLWEEANRAPYIWVVPGVTPKNVIAKQPVDFMTAYPTLCDLAGLEIPEHVQGKSIRKILSKPDSDWDGYAMSTYHPYNHTIRTAKWRYIRYANGAQELYDHAVDPYEWTNLANEEKYADILAKFADMLPREEKPFVRDK